MDGRTKGALAARLYADTTSSSLTNNANTSPSKKSLGRPGASSSSSLISSTSLERSPLRPKKRLAPSLKPDPTTTPGLSVSNSLPTFRPNGGGKRLGGASSWGAADDLGDILGPTGSKSYSSSYPYPRNEASLATYSQISEEDETSESPFRRDSTTVFNTSADLNQLPSPSAASAAAAGGATPAVLSSTTTSSSQPSPSFVASLNLSPNQMDDFLYTEGHFVYLQPKKGLARTSYDLEVVDHTQANSKDYYTLSKEGITHFLANESDFTPLHTWEREFAQFNKIRKIAFFMKYRKWKSFTVWKKNVRASKIGAAKSTIKSNLFVFVTPLRTALSHIRGLTVEVERRRLLAIDPHKTYYLEEFITLQKEIQDQLRMFLENFSLQVHEEVKIACDEVVDHFLRINNIVADHKMTFMERASLRSECRKLTRFLRLVDFVVIDTMRNLALDSVRETMAFVRPPGPPIKTIRYSEFDGKPPPGVKLSTQKGEKKPNAPLFSVHINFDQEGTLFVSPSPGEVVASIKIMLADAVKVLSIPERVFTHKEFAAYIMAETESAEESNKEEMSLQTIVNADENFTNITNDIYTHLLTAFEMADDYIEVFVPFRQTFLANGEYVENVKAVYKSSDLGEVVDAIEKYKGQAVEFEGIPYSAIIGILFVDSKDLKHMLMPSPVRCLAAIQKLLPELMNEAARSLIGELSRVLPVVMGLPTTVEEFVKKKKAVEEAQSSMESYKSRVAKVEEMAQLMKTQSWPIPEEQRGNLLIISENVTSLENGVQVAEGRQEEDTKRFAAEIENEVPNLKKKVVALRELLDASLIAQVDAEPDKVLSYLEKIEAQVLALKSRADKLQEYQAILNQNVEEYDVLLETTTDMSLKLRLWRGVRDWDTLMGRWMNTQLKDVDANELEKQVNLYNKTVFLASKGLPGNPVVPNLKTKVDEFSPVLPVVVNLRNNSLKDRHWNQIHGLIGFAIQGDDSFTLGKLIEKRVTDFADQITNIATSAVQESVLESMMEKVEKIWKTTEFEVKPYKDTKDLYIMGDVSEIIVNLDDSLVTINTVLGSRYVAGIREMVESWRRRLMLFQETLDEWTMCQRTWMYLETIFSSPDIVRQLPVAAKMFQTVDKSFRSIMRSVNDDPLAIKQATVKDRKETFQSHNASLDKIQKSLEDYLETKRGAFPRFYFLSNDELLEILSQAKEAQAVQPHLRKCFDNLVALEFGKEEGSVDILAMFSSEKERVSLGKNLKARGNVEDWLTQVENRMKSQLHLLLKAGLIDYDTKPRKEWILDHPGQVVATVAQMTWARDTETALRAEQPVAAMKVWYDRYVKDLDDLIVKIRGNLSKLHRSIIVALVTTDVHARDIIETLYDEKVDSIHNFTWQQQLRYYWDPALDDCLIKHSDAKIRYGYEYMGATSRLVITPLTDRCWLTLTGSYGLKLGAAPAGPAGTGKTESSKDLAKAMAILCVVFNCSDQIDYVMMGKLFRGLAQSGCWTCLDEFNRIDIEVLSVIAQQLLVLREGRLMGKTEINFMGVQIALKDHHVIITMNPGYAGRTELPDNLQVCFRPVAMMVPNYALIAEIMLFAEGFGDAKTLSRKMCKLYILASEQLSQQPHYDYGLRAVKSVLVMAGSLKRANPQVPEDLVLIRALRDSNVPKFLADDLPLFAAIVQDLFPGVTIPDNDYGEFQVALEEELVKHGLQKVPKFMTKIIQIFDIFNIRFGATLVGPTGSGKSTCYRILAAIMTNLRSKGSKSDLFQNVRYEILNPKCITMGELYGEFNKMTQEWHDGLASTIMRRAVADETMDKKWTVFDGPIDALWIENMNTVLDDNMTLCLANGERIKLKVEMKMLFEVMDLAVASPATVSRIGVVYMTPTDLGWFPYVQSWVVRDLPPQTTETMRQKILSNFEKILDKALKFQRRYCKEPVACVDIQLATSLTLIFQSLFKTERGVIFSKPEEDILKLIDRLFFFSYTWSVGGSINYPYWDKFDEFSRELFEAEVIHVGIPPTGLVFDYALDIAANEFRPWTSMVPSFHCAEGTPYFQMVVPTVDTVRFSYLMSTLITVDKPVFITGVTGTGKTIAVQELLKSLAPPKEEGGQSILSVNINFSAQTNSLITQSSIEAKLEKKRKNLLGAPAGKKVVIFVDDVNMPFVEEYGAQPPIELLRQFLDFKGFYDRDKLFWKDIQDTLLFAGAAPPGGGRNFVTPRFVRHFNVLCMPVASDSTMFVIFHSILSSFLHKGFEPDIKKMADGLVNGTIEVYNRISLELLPTPAKFHYTFNLRDISKVFQGIVMVKPQKCPGVDVMMRLWIHECMRVFYDRLINMEDQVWFKDLAVELITRHLRQSVVKEELFEKQPIIFCDFLKPGVDVKLYEDCRDMGKVTHLLNDYLDEYNASFPNQMNLVFFTDAIIHTARIARILRQPRGNAMLVGVGGSGKQSLTRIASYIAGYACVQIEINRGYGLNEFREDIKKFMIRAGVGGQNVVFLFTDSQIVVESMLEDINNVLNSGEIPNLFPQDETDKIVSDMIPVLKELGMVESRDNCLVQFTLRVRDYLHIVLCMSPVGDALRVRCRQFPSLINCTTIDWFMGWPKSALVQVADKFLATIPLPSEEIRAALVEMCGTVHTSITDAAVKFHDELRRMVYTTPKSYLDLINQYTSMLGGLQGEVDKKAERMTIGVKKLDDTNTMVQGLKEELKALEPVLAEKSVAAEKLLKQVAVDQAEASVIKEKVSKEAEAVNKQAAEVQEVQADAQKDLDAALPALNSALKALDSISKSDITIVKTFQNPPALVKVVMEAVCIMFDLKPDWESSKKLLGDPQFLDKLKGYKKDNIEEKTLKKIKPYLDNPDFNAETVKNVSSAAAGLCMWVGAMDVYARVAKDVEPKKARLAEMNRVLEGANAVLAKKMGELQAVLDKVNGLQRLCDATVAEKDQLAHDTEVTASRLVRAEKLTSGLNTEGVRWRATLVELAELKTNLIGDTFLSCACVSYYGPFTGSYRDALVEGWLSQAVGMGIPCSPNYSLTRTLGDPVQIREWQNCTLPTDAVSTNNAILVTRGRRWPLMIDPQMQANNWIRKMEEKNALEVTTMTNINLLRSLENCIRVGRPLLIEDVGEQLEPALEPVLLKAVFKQGNRTLIHLGDNDVDYDSQFRLFMTSKLPNPHYLPEVCIKVTVINFTVTMQGLEDQLLGEVVRLERPDIEDRKVRLLLRMAEDKKQLAEIEAKILKMLSESTGNILDDEELINTLANSKTTSSIIKERVEESEKTEKEINEAREKYRTAATRGSIIYFVIADLASIDPMYQYSLTYYQSLFNKCIQDSEKSDVLEKRLRIIIDYSTLVIYENICRGIFEKDKILFSSLICFQILRAKKEIRDHEWILFVRGAGVVDRANQPENPQPTRINEFQWDIITAAETKITLRPTEEGGEEIHPFKDIASSMKKDWDQWLDWSNSTDPINAPLPGPYKKSISPFQKLILIKIFREDRLLLAVQHFVSHRMGSRFAESPAAKMDDIYRDMDNKTPCIFILSTGADPTGMLLRFAREKGYGDKLSLVSLGQGQGPYATELIDKGSKTGNWVLLQNCMLAKSWMPSLEKIVFALGENSANNHPEFRLFLTSAPAKYFPVSILQNGVKMTNEPPKGVRANVVRSIGNLVKEEYWESCAKPREWKKLLCGLCFFHANIQERRKFGPLGWNIRYAFDESDLETSIAIMRRFLEEQEEIPWDALRFVTGQINYGGRVTDDWDRRCLMSILGYYVTPRILDDDYRFSKSVHYFAPKPGGHKKLLDYFNALPASDDPIFFGMHDNANVTFQSNESSLLMGTILSLQPRASGGGGEKSSDETVLDMAKDILVQVPALLDEEEAGPTTFIIQENGLLGSLAIVLTQEMVKFNRLLNVMTSSLADLQKAIKGLIVMTQDLDMMYTAFLVNKVPSLWTKVSFASLKTLSSWVKDLIYRIDFLRVWLKKGQPTAFSLPVFFFPQGFMTGTLQTFARKYQVAIDTLQFKFSVLDTEPEDISLGPDDGVYVYGLWMEGARFDRDKKLMQPSRPGEMYTTLPVIHFIPTVGHRTLPTDYACPVYKTSERKGVLSTTGMSTNYVVAIELPTDVPPDTWVLYGVAALCNLTD